MTLTIKAVESAKPRERGYKLADGAGLYLFVTPAGNKSWRANHVRDGKQATRTYGRWPAVSLADARKAHQAVRNAPAQGAITFGDVARAWLKIKLPTLSNGKHQGQVSNTLAVFVLPTLGDRPIAGIKRAELVTVVRDVQTGGRIETAHRVASRVTEVFNYAQDEGLLEHHPAAGLTRTLASRKVRKPMACIPVHETGALLQALDGYSDPVTREGLQLLALTFTRTGELRGMRWDELREDGALWVIPPERMKLRLPHVVPLSTQAQAILATLREMTGDGPLVFDSPVRPGRALSENTFLFALYRLGYRGHMTAHGFRALASSVLNEHSGFAPDVIERQLAHKETDAVRAAYNRAQYLPQRRELMQWWADWLDSQRAAANPPSASE
ncbi:DUF4102 domain-containing protein [Verminephrobacter aporrectodeae subsp. tuberculatae]|uniref:DUF4102 domain-containing protein n=1 Tax=Verminephrobacter aporrectodeae subsp. tuberculatae TaxID=1110392 RepID=A0ABT3KP03_9BURK|nr:integrase arm-type DNA-binding domain-containing protein [Verminephrobacter aporrectodeae]MCW5319669.1 DUF4102 domain-containing protein [Verminephrobacter aporrectodeae subsp. tuberculatae]